MLLALALALALGRGGVVVMVWCGFVRFVSGRNLSE